MLKPRSSHRRRLLSLGAIGVVGLSPSTGVLAQEYTTNLDQPQASPREQEIRDRLKDRQQDEADRWRRYGDIEVDWQNWQPLKRAPSVWVTAWRRATTKPRSIGGLHWPEAVNTTGQEEIPERAIAIDCNNLTLNRKRAGANWGEWRVPQTGTVAETLLVAVCTTL